MASFAKVPHELVADPDVSDGAKILYAWLTKPVWRSHSYGDPLPTIVKMSEGTGKSQATIKRQLSELENHGWLYRESRKGGPAAWMTLSESRRRTFIDVSTLPEVSHDLVTSVATGIADAATDDGSDF